MFYIIIDNVTDKKYQVITFFYWRENKSGQKNWPDLASRGTWSKV